MGDLAPPSSTLRSQGTRVFHERGREPHPKQPRGSRWLTGPRFVGGQESALRQIVQNIGQEQRVLSAIERSVMKTSPGSRHLGWEFEGGEGRCARPLGSANGEIYRRRGTERRSREPPPREDPLLRPPGPGVTGDGPSDEEGLSMPTARGRSVRPTPSCTRHTPPGPRHPHARHRGGCCAPHLLVQFAAPLSRHPDTEPGEEETKRRGCINKSKARHHWGFGRRWAVVGFRTGRHGLTSMVRVRCGAVVERSQLRPGPSSLPPRPWFLLQHGHLCLVVPLIRCNIVYDSPNTLSYIRQIQEWGVLLLRPAQLTHPPFRPRPAPPSMSLCRHLWS